MITSSVNTVISTERFINNVNLNNHIYVNKEDIFDSSNTNYNSNFDLINENTNNKYMMLTNKDNIEEQIDKRIELKNMQCKYGFGTSQYLEQNCKINDNCTDLEKSVIIKEEIIIPDTLESDLPSNGFIRVDERFNNKTINWLNAKSILRPKIDKYRDQKEKISFSNVKTKMIIKRKPKNICMIVEIIDKNTPPSEAIVESVLSGNKKVPVSDNDESSSKVEDSTEDLEPETVLKSSIHREKKIAEQMSATEIENEYFDDTAETLKTVRASRKHLRMNFCENGYLRILKNIAKLQKEKGLKKAEYNLMQTQENIPNNINHFKENNNNDDNNNTSLNIKIENVSQAKSFLKNRNPVSANVEKIKETNLVPRAKSILKPKIHILDTKANKIIIAQSESSGRTKLFRAKKIETPTKVIEQIKSKCLLFCSNCSIYQKIGWKDDLKKCTTCFKEMKYMCYECKEIFSSSVQFYVHEMCSCKAKLESGYYWKCSDCNYLVLKMTNCHQNFCRKHPLLKCKYCSSLMIHLSEFTKHSIKKSSIIKKAEHTAGSIDDEDNLGIELECTPLSSMSGQKLNSEKNFELVCPTGCKHPARKSSAGKLLCLLCSSLKLYKCLGCKALLKTYRAAYRHCSWCCSSVRTYYCASCDIFSQRSYDRVPPSAPTSSEVHRCRNCPARFDSRGKLNAYRRSCDVLSQQGHDDGAPPSAPTTSTAHRCRNCLARFDFRGKLNAHRLNCDESLWLQCGLCPLKLGSPRTLREHLDEVHREHANVALRARVFKFAVQAWRRSTDQLEWKVEKISESKKNHLKDENLPMVLLEKLPDHVVENLISGQKIWTCEAIEDVEDILPDEGVSIISDEEDDKSTDDRLSFFNSQQTAYLNNINSLLEIPDSDEEATRVADNLLIEKNQNSEFPFKPEKQVSHNKVSRVIEKLSKQKVPVERTTSYARRRRIKKRRSEPLRCEHCGYLTNAKMELVEHIMSRHAARLFRGVGFDCPHCSCVFSNYHIYERHLQSRHRLQR